VADVTFTDVERLAAADAADVPLAMDEDAFRAFYDRTAPSLWSYLARISGSRQLADDLLQEAYYRLLKAPDTFENEAHRRNYLFRVATNLVRDTHRGGLTRLLGRAVPIDERVPADEGSTPERRADVRRALHRLKPRERALLWLAYAEGSSHTEIARVLGVKAASIKLLLFRARRKMAALLDGRESKKGARS
jgi:RNA polymerase sigma-70 factor (ECF subfamily)